MVRSQCPALSLAIERCRDICSNRFRAASAKNASRSRSRFFPEFVSNYPSWEKLSKAKRNDLRRLVPLGLWRRRADILVALAKEMVRCRGRFSNTAEKLGLLPGVGQYIANAILLFAHRQRVPLLDVNMARVLERNFGPRKLVDIRYDPYLQSLASRVVANASPRNLNWAILDLAALVCTPRNPKCPQCPLLPGV